MPLSLCTLTGVDDSTPLPALADIAARFPSVEFGLLWSPRRAGSGGRYPAFTTILGALTELPDDVNLALHICGQGVDDAIDGRTLTDELVTAVAKRRGRIQLNFNYESDDIPLSKLRALLERHAETTFITQANSSNGQPIIDALAGLPNHALLFDGSGGRGILSPQWPAPIGHIPCGYAGGLSADNVVAEVAKMTAVAAGRPFWIDMESSLRWHTSKTNDWFDLQACIGVLAKLFVEGLIPASNVTLMPVKAPIALPGPVWGHQRHVPALPSAKSA